MKATFNAGRSLKADLAAIALVETAWTGRRVTDSELWDDAAQALAEAWFADPHRTERVARHDAIDGQLVRVGVRNAKLTQGHAVLELEPVTVPVVAPPPFDLSQWPERKDLSAGSAVTVRSVWAEHLDRMAEVEGMSSASEAWRRAGARFVEQYLRQTDLAGRLGRYPNPALSRLIEAAAGQAPASTDVTAEPTDAQTLKQANSANRNGGGRAGGKRPGPNRDAAGQNAPGSAGHHARVGRLIGGRGGAVTTHHDPSRALRLR